MRLMKALSTPWLLRRLVKSHESQAQALEEIRDILYIAFDIPRSPREPVEEDDDDSYTIATDRDTYEREAGLRRRTRKESDE